MVFSTISSPYVAGIMAAGFTYLALKALSRRNNNMPPLPPGPPRRPIIGNLLEMPIEKAWVKFYEWTEQYGGIAYIEALGNTMLILGNEEAVLDLLDRRAVNFSNRVRLNMLIDLMGFDWALPLLPYGEKWRKDRRFLHNHVHSNASPAYQGTQLHSARTFVADLLAAKHDKDILPRMVRAYLGRTIIKMTYGLDVKGQDDEYITIPERVMDAISQAAIPGKFLVDTIPALKYVPTWLPGAGFKSFAQEIKRSHRQMRDAPFKAAQEQIASGVAPVSILQKMLESVDEEYEQAQEMVKDLAGVVYVAGADTTVASVLSFFLAMVIYPDVQRRAQAELDAIVGRERLPEFSDQDRLPYVRAVISECLRWLPAFPLGIPHVTAEDDTYRGHFIPKGTIVLPNQWALLRDPVMFPEPLRFSPERYLTHTQSPKSAESSRGDKWTPRSDVRDPRDFAFGFGRRICPGSHIAEQSLFATIATVLHTIDVRRVKDADGVDIIPEVDVSGGSLSHPLPFVYEIQMRSDAKELVDMCSQK